MVNINYDISEMIYIYWLNVPAYEMHHVKTATNISSSLKVGGKFGS
jgi:hypothetical protein